MLKKNSSHTRIICGLLRESWHCNMRCETRYCLVQGSNPSAGRDFSQLSKPALGPPSPLDSVCRICPMGKVARAWR
jgi:hypothetical protein